MYFKRVKLDLRKKKKLITLREKKAIFVIFILKLATVWANAISMGS